jgi:hypothetical protein
MTKPLAGVETIPHAYDRFLRALGVLERARGAGRPELAPRAAVLAAWLGLACDLAGGAVDPTQDLTEREAREMLAESFSRLIQAIEEPG